MYGIMHLTQGFGDNPSPLAPLPQRRGKLAAGFAGEGLAEMEEASYGTARV